MKQIMEDSDVSEDISDLEIDSEDEDRAIDRPTLNELDRYSDECTDSETEALQEAFAKGILKPGLNVPAQEKKQFVNNGAKLKEKLTELTLDLPWIEKLDVITKPASIAPELAKQLEENQEPIVRDDFKRESLFYRQAQAAVMVAIPKLHSLGIITKRPDDYFAEMAKSDSHMQKVKSKLIQQKAVIERIEKVRQLRKQKKMQKAIQAESKLKKQNARKELANEVKKFRKGERKDLSFLEDKPTAPLKRKITKKRQRRDNKFGFGGRKKGLKRNTQSSLDGTIKKKGAKKATKMNRPGKERRKNMKNKKR